MIQMQSKLTVADNTGAKVVGCIKVLGGSRRRYAHVGSIIIGSVKKIISGSNIKQGEVVGIKDPNGFRPLCLGKLNGHYVLAPIVPISAIKTGPLKVLQPGALL